MAKTTRSFDETYDVVVIGAGLGGLSCGAFLAKGGRRVKVWEKEPAPGGYCTSFERQGFRFGSALLFTNGYGPDGIMTRMLAELGMEGRIKVSKLEPFCRVILPKGSFTIPAAYLSKYTKNYPTTIVLIGMSSGTFTAKGMTTGYAGSAILAQSDIILK